MLIWKPIFMKITVFKLLFTLNSDQLEFLKYILPFKSYEWKHLIFFNSVWPQCEAFLANFQLLCVQNVVEWALITSVFCCRKLRCKALLQSLFWTYRKNDNSAAMQNEKMLKNWRGGVKGAVSRDFWTLFFFINRIHLGPWQTG